MATTKLSSATKVTKNPINAPIVKRRARYSHLGNKAPFEAMKAMLSDLNVFKGIQINTVGDKMYRVAFGHNFEKFA